jgi:hypothetical protein
VARPASEAPETESTAKKVGKSALGWAARKMAELDDKVNPKEGGSGAGAPGSSDVR